MRHEPRIRVAVSIEIVVTMPETMADMLVEKGVVRYVCDNRRPWGTIETQMVSPTERRMGHKPHGN
jgi:hypothetical protein